MYLKDLAFLNKENKIITSFSIIIFLFINFFPIKRNAFLTTSLFINLSHNAVLDSVPLS